METSEIGKIQEIEDRRIVYIKSDLYPWWSVYPWEGRKTVGLRQRVHCWRQRLRVRANL